MALPDGSFTLADALLGIETLNDLTVGECFSLFHFG